MRTLDLDFHRRSPSGPWGWLLLLAGLATLGALLGAQQRWEEESRILQVKLEKLEARLPRPASAKPESDLALAAARKTLDKSRLPWGSLFTALESADSQDVALLAVIPDGPRGQVKIHAEARNLAAMLAYHRRLEQGSVLRQVTLVDHETSGEPGAASVRFHISADWGPDHGHP